MQHQKTSASTPIRASKIQVEVREVPTVSKQTTVSRLDVDGDSGDVRSE